MGELIKSGFMLEPTSMEEAWKYAEMLAKSQFVPTAFQSNQKNGDQTANVFFACQYGARLGLDPLLAVQNIAVVNGKPAVYGDLMLAICQASPQFEYCTETFDANVNEWTCKCKRKSSPSATVRTFSLNDAVLAHYITLGANGEIKKQKWDYKTNAWTDDKFSPWVTNPKRMLQMRARSFALRDTFADVLKGIACREEVVDIVPEVDVVVAPKVEDKAVVNKSESIKNKIRKAKAQTEDEFLQEVKTEEVKPLMTSEIKQEISTKMLEAKDINELKLIASDLNKYAMDTDQDTYFRKLYAEMSAS